MRPFSCTVRPSGNCGFGKLYGPPPPPSMGFAIRLRSPCPEGHPVRNTEAYGLLPGYFPRARSYSIAAQISGPMPLQSFSITGSEI